MTEKQFRCAIQANIKCGKRALDAYCKNHDPEYTDDEYNQIISGFDKEFSSSRRKKSIISINASDKLISIYKKKSIEK